MRQPYAAPNTPLKVRASSAPTSSPPSTVPTIRPRSRSGAWCAANGTITCTVEAVRPTTKLATLSHTTFGELAVNASATEAATSSVEISRRRSYLSPSGTKISMPVPMPICVSMNTAPTWVTDRPNSRAMSASSGCA